MSLFDKAADYLINRAKRTVYFHLPEYMERYWLVPYIAEGTHSGNGCIAVSFLKRPIAWVMQKFGIAARVHHIMRSDDDRAFHDHPWDYTTVILKGGYWEITPNFDDFGRLISTTRKWYGPGSIIRRKAASWHILELHEGQPAWTLFITGKYKQGWGFLSDGVKVPYKQYLGIEEQS